jgi:hypothetical protein
MGISAMTKFRAALAVFFFGLASIAYAQAPSTPTAIQTLINQNIPDGQTGGVRANQVRPTFNSLLPFTYLYYDTMTGLLKNFNGTSWVTYTLPISQLGTFPTMTVACNPAGSAANFSSCTLSSTLAFTGSALGVANSVALPGSPSTTTQAATDNSTKIATTAFVRSQLPTLNAEFYGFVADGVTDNCGVGGPKDQLLAAIVYPGAYVAFPAGAFNCSTNIALPDVPLEIDGGGTGTRIIFTNATSGAAGFTYTSTGAYALRMRNIRIETSVDQPNNAAVTEVYPDIGGSTFNLPPAFEGVSITGGPSDAHYWNIGLDLTHFLTGHIIGTFITGKNSIVSGKIASPGNMATGIVLRGHSEDTNAYSLHTIFANVGVQINDDSEGFKCVDCTNLATNWGYDIHIPSFPAWRVEGGHNNTFLGGIWTHGSSMGYVGGGAQFWKRGESTANWIGVLLDDYTGSIYGGGSACSTVCGSNSTQIIGAYFNGWRETSSGGTSYGVYLGSNANAALVSANSFNSMTGAVAGNNSGAINYITNNVGFDFANGWVYNVGPNAIIYNNFPVDLGNDLAHQTLGLNNATPTIGGVTQNIWYTNSSSATTITNFLNGYANKQFTLVAGDANTTLQHNSGLLLKGGVNVTLASGAVISFIRDQGLWRETSRDF